MKASPGRRGSRFWRGVGLARTSKFDPLVIFRANVGHVDDLYHCASCQAPIFNRLSVIIIRPDETGPSCPGNLALGHEPTWSACDGRGRWTSNIAPIRGLVWLAPGMFSDASHSRRVGRSRPVLLISPWLLSLDVTALALVGAALSTFLLYVFASASQIHFLDPPS
jgi:hypothetical protein